MKTLKLPVNGHTNGHARFQDADFTEAQRKQDLPLDPLVQDPTKEEGPITTPRKKLKSVAFQKLLAEIEQEETQQPRAERPAFPLHALPPALRTWVEAIATQTQTAPEAAAMLGLAASSAALAGRVSILGTDDAWHPVNLYVGVLTAGDRCDEVMSSAIEPLRELEFEELEKAERARAKDCVLHRDEVRAYEKAERMIDDQTPLDDLHEINERRYDLEMFEPLPAPRRVLDDVTARSLRHQLAQLGRIACFSPTGDIFRQIAGRSTASRQRLVETLDAGHAGRRLVVDGPRGKQTAVKSPLISIGSLVDRSLVSAIASQRECHARSLLARCLFVSPESRIGSRECEWTGPASEVLAGYRDGIHRLANWKANMPDSTQVIPSFEAMNMLVHFSKEIEPQLGPRGALAPIGDWAKNLADATIRLAGILHAWTDDSGRISAETFAAAIEIARWLVPQAAYALERLGAADDDCSDRERALLRYARIATESGATGDCGATGSLPASADATAADRNPRGFSPRSAWQHLRKTFLDTAALRRAFARLVRRGYLLVAREGENFPRRFALAALSVALIRPEPAPIPAGRAGKRARRKARRAAEMAAIPCDFPSAAMMDEITKSTQAEVRELLDGGASAAKSTS